MHSFFFGSSSHKLYGCVEQGAGRSGVVICGSWGAEEQAAHRFLRVVRGRLAEAGYTAMRFDYFGGGDSHGSQRDLSLDSMTEDTLCALGELRDLAEPDATHLIGYRLGAVPALLAAREIGAALLLIDPVLDGRGWLQTLAAAPSAREQADGSLESGGFVLGATLRDALDTPTSLVDPPDSHHVVRAIYSEPHPAAPFPSEKVTICQCEPTWQLHEGVGMASIPLPLVDAVLEGAKQLDRPAV